MERCVCVGGVTLREIGAQGTGVGEWIDRETNM